MKIVNSEQNLVIGNSDKYIICASNRMRSESIKSLSNRRLMNLTLLKFTYSHLVMMNFFIGNENVYDEHAFFIYYRYIFYISYKIQMLYTFSLRRAGAYLQIFLKNQPLPNV